MLLGEILIQKKLISCQQLNFVLTQQQKKPKKLGELLLDFRLISSEELAKALQEQYWRENGYWVIGAIDRAINCESFDSNPKKGHLTVFQ